MAEKIEEDRKEDLRDDILDDDKGLLAQFEEEDDYEGIKKDIRRQIELLKISSGAKPRVNSVWNEDPFISYKKMNRDYQILSERNSKINYVKDNITRAGNSRRGLMSNNGSLSRVNSSAEMENDNSLGISPYSARMSPKRMNKD